MGGYGVLMFRPVKAQWLSQRAKERQPKNGEISNSFHGMIYLVDTAENRIVLDIGCYAGLSALAFYEGTKESQAQVKLPSSPPPASFHLLISDAG